MPRHTYRRSQATKSYLPFFPAAETKKGAERTLPLEESYAQRARHADDQRGNRDRCPAQLICELTSRQASAAYARVENFNCCMNITALRVCLGGQDDSLNHLYLTRSQIAFFGLSRL